MLPIPTGNPTKLTKKFLSKILKSQRILFFLQEQVSQLQVEFLHLEELMDSGTN